MTERVCDSLAIRTYGLFDEYRGVTHAITTRKGGVSAAPYATLNLGLHVGDDEDTVLRNRSLLSAITGCEPDALTFGAQVHDANIAVVDASNAGGGFEDTDALITDAPDIPLCVLVADCVVVGLYDPVRNTVGIAHAGWRGTLASIAQKTVDAMRATFGSHPRDIIASISPSIGPCCYEVGPDVVDAFYAGHDDIAPEVFSDPDMASAGSFAGGVNEDRKMLDLWKANELILEQAGVLPSHIETAGICTACDTDTWFSHRAEKGRTGRFAGILQLHGRTRRAW